MRMIVRRWLASWRWDRQYRYGYWYCFRRAVWAAAGGRNRADTVNSTPLDAVREELRLSEKRREEYENALLAIHNLVSPGQPWYSWQRVYQNVERLMARQLTASDN
jgi:hypothetical protein